MLRMTISNLETSEMQMCEKHSKRRQKRMLREQKKERTTEKRTIRQEEGSQVLQAQLRNHLKDLRSEVMKGVGTLVKENSQMLVVQVEIHR